MSNYRKNPDPTAMAEAIVAEVQRELDAERTGHPIPGSRLMVTRWPGFTDALEREAHRILMDEVDEPALLSRLPGLASAVQVSEIQPRRYERITRPPAGPDCDSHPAAGDNDPGSPG